MIGKRLLATVGIAELALSPSGDRVALSPRRGGLEVVNVDRPQYPVPLEKPGVVSSELTWSPDSSLLAVSGRQEARVYAVASRALVWRRWSTVSPRWSPDGSRLAVYAAWDQERLTVIVDAHHWRTLKEVPGAVRLTWSPDCRKAVANYTPDTFPYDVYQVLDGITLNHLVDVSRDVSNIASISWSPDSRLLAFGGDWPVFGPPSDTCVVDASTGAVLKKLPDYYSQVRAIAWAPDSSRVALTYAMRESDGHVDIVLVHDVRTGKVVYQLGGPSMMIFDLRWDRAGDRIRAGAGDGRRMEVWEWTVPTER